MISIKENSFYGLLGFVIPTLIMLVAYPVLVRSLGSAAFGIYILATSMSGVLAFLDFGFSAATLKFVAEDLSKNDHKGAADVIFTSLLFYGGLGSVVAFGIWVLSPWLVKILSVSDLLRSDAILVFRIAAIQFAVSMLTSVFVSLFKGLQRFDQSSIMFSMLSVMTYGTSIIAVLLFDVGVVAVTTLSLMSNLMILFIASITGARLSENVGINLRTAKVSFFVFKRMFGFGSAMAVNALSGVFLYQVQRYLISALIGPAAVTIYHLATTIPVKAHTVISVATEIMFPLTSASSDIKRLRLIYLRMLFGSGVVAICILLPLALFSKPIIAIWLGDELAGNVAPLIPIFCLSYFFLALSPAPYHFINGTGRPWLNAISYGFNAMLNIGFIAIFAINGITLDEFAWAFAIANITNGLLYQCIVEVCIWKNHLLPVQRVLKVTK